MLKLGHRTPEHTPDSSGQPDTGRKDSGRTLSGAVSGAPRWVGWFTDIGRPLSAIVVMVLCAPGERHLAELAGWGPNLSWGMAGLLVMYAGIAAVVATVRPKGAPGKKTAVLGAIVSLMLAMAAQPVSHYFVTGWMTDSPRAPFWLVTVVSCVPPFVMGHLLHLAADPGTAQNGVQDGPAADAGTEGARTAAQAATAQRRADYVRARMNETVTSEEALRELWNDAHPDITEADDGDELSWSDASRWTPDDLVQGGHETPLSGYVPDVRPVEDSGSTDLSVRLVRSGGPDSGQLADRFRDGMSALAATSGLPDTLRHLSAAADRMEPDSGRTADGQVPDTFTGRRTDGGRTGDSTGADMSAQTAGPTGRTADGQRTADITPDTDMGTFIRDTWTLNPKMDRTAMRTVVRRSFPDKKADAIRKAVARAEEARRS